MGGRTGAGLGAIALLAALSVGRPAPAAAQAPAADAARPSKSVYGKLVRVDASRNGLVMESDGGEHLAWQFDPKVIAAVSEFKPGSRVIVIYRQVTPNEKRVTAVAFPGTAETPIYVNTTGSRVVVRSSPAVGETCGDPSAGPVSEYTVPSGGVAEVLEACWCCAVPGEPCTPGNRSGLGRAFLVRCFK